MEYNKKTRKWDMWEVSVKGPKEGNPFTEQNVKGIFVHKNETKQVDGFYDGNGIYKVRFMPSFEGHYCFTLQGSFIEKEFTGEFEVLKAGKENHGPVRVVNTYHFAYEDGTPCYPLGTTCYVWQLQSDALIKKTLEMLEQAGFNKIRFCILPKHMDYNMKEPRMYPYEGTPMDSSVLTRDNVWDYMGPMEGNDWDFERFNPKYFQHVENCIYELQKRGIEADLIVMHPYDRWGFSYMNKEQDDLYWKYVIARFAAYSNVWWSLANEYDTLRAKNMEDWERYAAILCEKDPYAHLRSIHNCVHFYDHRRPWITHCSIQKQEIYKTAEYTDKWREMYGKPVVLDEISYEGNLPQTWGNIDGQEMIRRFWEAACRGGYAGHGETFEHPENILWWSHGGELHGESWKRIKFLHQILKDVPSPGLALAMERDGFPVATTEKDKLFGTKNYYLNYFGFTQPASQVYYFDDETEYKVEVIDTWEMTIEEIGVYKGKFRISLPGKRYIAVRLMKV